MIEFPCKKIGEGISSLKRKNAILTSELEKANRNNFDRPKLLELREGIKKYIRENLSIEYNGKKFRFDHAALLDELVNDYISSNWKAFSSQEKDNLYKEDRKPIKDIIFRFIKKYDEKDYIITDLRISNHFERIPNIPDGIINLEIGAFGINTTYFNPHLPRSLKTFDCSGRKLTSLPDLPENLEFLNAEGNKLYSSEIEKIKKHKNAANFKF